MIKQYIKIYYHKSRRLIIKYRQQTCNLWSGANFVLGYFKSYVLYSTRFLIFPYICSPGLSYPIFQSVLLTGLLQLDARTTFPPGELIAKLTMKNWYPRSPKLTSLQSCLWKIAPYCFFMFCLNRKIVITLLYNLCHKDTLLCSFYRIKWR